MGTMLNMNSQIELYENMGTISARMAEAARAHDWDELVSLEKSVARLRASLETDDDNSKLSSIEIERKRSLIQKILDDDAEVRRHTEPWMEQVRKFLGEGRRARQMERAYGQV
ncbi:MAG TPA: flagellar protein FliT [Rhodocyclaceae bacterium]|nr:flagellar protein FliT [Rhodocyclaceae bacterium]